MEESLHYLGRNLNAFDLSYLCLSTTDNRIETYSFFWIEELLLVLY